MSRILVSPLLTAPVRALAIQKSTAKVSATCTNSGNRTIWTVIALLRDLHELLAEVLALEHAHEGRRGILEAFGDVLAVLDPPPLDPLRDLADEIVEAPPEIHHDEAADGEALGEHGAEDLRSLVFHVRRVGRAILRDQPAHRNAREWIEQWKHRVPDLTGHILEIDVDPLRARGLEFLGERWVAVIDAIVA